MIIDTAFDFRSDAGRRDPDSRSKTLRRYHQLLWSKPLPDGAPFELDVTTKGDYLHHRSDLGEFWLSSDSVIPSFTGHIRMAPITDQLSDEEHQSFIALTYTMGGMLVFPSNRIDRKPTINGARGLTRKISDRMDLTLECIRLFYRGEWSPLKATLDRYDDFFRLFGSFRGYVQFFLLDDLLTPDGSAVRFFLPFADFDSAPTPQDLGSYRDYREKSMDFVRARNLRINQFCTSAS